MPMPTASSSFESEINTMIQALASPRGIEVECESDRAAAHLRLRMYSARRTLQRESRKIYPPENPSHGRSDFDSLTFKLLDNKLIIVPGDKIEYKVREL